MKTVSLIFIILCSSYLLAAQVSVAIAIAQTKGDGCNHTDIGYSYKTGTAMPLYMLQNEADESVKRRFPQHDRIDRFKLSDVSYIVIVAGTSESNGCSRYTYGVGGGRNRAEALKAAVDLLDGRNWEWNHNNGYDIIVEEELD
jgi:hypothetical protein